MQQDSRRGTFGALLALGVLIAGVGCIVAAARIERTEAGLWKDLCVYTSDTPLTPQSQRAYLVSLDEANYPFIGLLRMNLENDPEATRLIDSMGLYRFEPLLIADFPASPPSNLLSSGRWPTPGTREVLAGTLALLERPVIAGEEHEVVGRLAPNVGALAQAYLMPLTKERTAAYEAAGRGRWVWFAPDGASELESLLKAKDTTAPRNVYGGSLTSPRVRLLMVLGMMLVAGAGAVLQVRLLQAIGGRLRWLAPFSDACTAHPTLLTLTHLAAYGIFFSMSLLGLLVPQIPIVLTRMVETMFTTGDLSYIGAAYASGNILRATVATFVNNYCMATVLLTFLPSLFIPLAGVFKTLLSFAMVGLVFAPVRTGIADPMVYHVITMTLELEAYILASFAVILYTARTAKGLFTGSLNREFPRALTLIVVALIVTGLQLLLAAFYEAATLIWLA